MKKVLLALGTLIFAAGIFGATAEEVRAKYEALEQSYQALEAKEEANYQDMKTKAGVAETQLVKQRALEAQLQAKIPQLKKNAKTSPNGEKYAELAGEFEGALGELRTDIKANEKLIADYKKLDALKNPPVKAEKPAKVKKEKPAKPAKAEKAKPAVKKPAKK